MAAPDRRGAVVACGGPVLVAWVAAAGCRCARVGLSGAGRWWPGGAAVDGGVGGAGGGGAVAVELDGPAPPVHGDLMVEVTQSEQVTGAGRAVEGAGDQVVRVVGAGGFAAPAGPLAGPGVPHRDGPPDVPGDVVA